MTPTNRSNLDTTTRLALLEAYQRNVNGDLAEIKVELKELRKDFNEGRRGMTTAEKIALGSASAAVIGVFVAFAALLQGAPT